MKRNIIAALILSSCLIATKSAAADAIFLQRVASRLSFPLFATAPANDQNRLFILEKNSARIRVVNRSNNQLNASDFLRVDRITNEGERGLLSLAFHPDYKSNRQFFVSVTNQFGDVEIRRYLRGANADIADPDSETVLLTIPQFASNHNGGWIGFGPDGFLYIASGDGGGGNDPEENGQDLTTLLGSMLRIDVNSDDFPNDSSRNYAIPESNPFIDTVVDSVPARPEIWAYGLRNPWRNSFDRQTGDLLIADVGQGQREEVNFQSAQSAGGENYGWRLREGDIATPNVGGNRPTDNVDPIYAYPRSGTPFSGASVTGGYVYRGPIASLQGQYFFGDFTNGRIWSFLPGSNSISQLTDWTSLLATDQGQVNNIASFGEDADGNLYVIDFDGDVFKLVDPNSPPQPTNPAANDTITPIFLLLEDD